MGNRKYTGKPIPGGTEITLLPPTQETNGFSDIRDSKRGRVEKELKEKEANEKAERKRCFKVLRPED